VQITGEPDADVLDVPLHWHETHDEFIRVVEGQLEIALGSHVQLYGPEDGEVRIPKGVAHGLRTYKGVRCTLEERTDPMVSSLVVTDSTSLKTEIGWRKGNLLPQLAEFYNKCLRGDASDVPRRHEACVSCSFQLARESSASLPSLHNGHSRVLTCFFFQSLWPLLGGSLLRYLATG
jgi:hypothetical protein